MGQIIFDTATTLNGWIADQQNSLDWLFAVENGDEPPEGTYPADATVLVMGSTTYEWVLNHEDVLAHPERWQDWYAEVDRELRVLAEKCEQVFVFGLSAMRQRTVTIIPRVVGLSGPKT